MAYTITKVKNYRYEFRSIGTERIAVVYLFSEDDLICMAVFVDNNEPLTSPAESISGHVYVTYNYSWLSGIFDMLRNEKPVFFTWNSDVNIASITTEDEPIGEEEKRGFLASIFGK